MSVITFVIVNWNNRDLLLRCLQSIEIHASDVPHDVIVVDNASRDDGVAIARAQFPNTRFILNHKNVGFAAANNRGVTECNTPFALLLNTDAFLSPDALHHLMDVIQSQPMAGMVGAHLRNADGTFQASHSRFSNLWREFLILSGIGRKFFGYWYPSHAEDHESQPCVVDYVEGACMLIRCNAYRQIGGMDESFFMYAEEVDLCYRLKENGWQVWYQPLARVTHLGGGSSSERKTQREVDLYRSRVRFFRKHYGGFAAKILKLQICAMTMAKTVIHGVLRFLTNGRRGRLVVPLRDIARL
jgi:hypothetical protein